MIAEANVRSMEGLKCTFMGFTFSPADAFRHSFQEWYAFAAWRAKMSQP